jgi:hypothetical protein
LLVVPLLLLLLLLLQAQGVGGRLVKYSGMGDVFRQTYVNEGLRGFYKVGVGFRVYQSKVPLNLKP